MTVTVIVLDNETRYVMPSEKPLTKIIPKIYKCNTENIGLFFFVRAQLQLFPTMEIQKAFNNFRKFTGVTIDDWDDECMRTTYNRVQNLFIERKE